MASPLLILLLTLPDQKQPLGRPSLPPTSVSPAVVPTVADDEATLKAASLDTAGPALLDFFRTRAAPPGRERVAGLVNRLADKDPVAQKKAAGELARAGSVAVAALRRAANAVEDSAATARARHCLEAVEGPASVNLARAAARLVATRKPPGAAEALLGYLPFADDDAVADEVVTALAAVGAPGGRPDPALTRALEDKSPSRRAAAGEVLCKVGGPADRAAVRVLLKDPRPTVRLRAALALARTYDPEAVPVLVAALADAAPAQRKAAEEYLAELAGDWAVATPQGADPLAARIRRDAWAAWWSAADGPSLLAEFRSRTLTAEEYDRAADMIRRLGEGDADARAKASEGLTALAPRCLPLLRQAAGRGNARAAKLADALERDHPAAPLPAAAGRLLALRHPEGALEAVLGYLPAAEGEDVADELRELLVPLGFRDGKPEPALVAALADKRPALRAAAAGALCRGGAAEELPAVRGLLKDADADVRLRAALALAGRGEREAVPALIGLLTELPPEGTGEVEDFLARLAGDKPPEVPEGGPEKVRDAWAAWWREHGATADLAAVGQTARPRGHLLALEPWNANNNGRVVELNASGKVVWQLGGMTGPVDAQVLPNRRLLVAEQNANRVTERDRGGKVVWERAVPTAFVCQRLPNGHTFLAGRNFIVELDRAGKELLNQNRAEYLMAARKLPNGHIALVNNQGHYVRLDAAGKELKRFTVPVGLRGGMTSAEVLPGDHTLVATQHMNRVAEYDGEGKVVWEATVPQPGCPARLPNGHTLVPSINAGTATELDGKGKVVGEKKQLAVRPWRLVAR
jgi:HEAT repeat protein